MFVTVDRQEVILILVSKKAAARHPLGLMGNEVFGKYANVSLRIPPLIISTTIIFNNIYNILLFLKSTFPQTQTFKINIKLFLVNVAYYA